MPALGVKKQTFHRWGDCGYIYLGRPGTGKSVILTGEEILYAACLVVLSKVIGNSQFIVRGLRDCISHFRSGLEQWPRGYDKEGNSVYFEERDMYAVFKFTERCGAIDAEWQLSDNPLEYREDRKHITEHFGHKAAPYHQAIYLSELLRDLILKIDGRKV